jgi:hypothetical protein
MVTAPLANKQVANTPIQVRLPDGASIQSSHTCDLVLHQIPDTEKKAHVIPGLSTRSLLSVGQLVDSNCSVIFDKSKVQVLHKNANILEGRRNLRNGLWTCMATHHNHTTLIRNQDWQTHFSNSQTQPSPTINGWLLENPTKALSTHQENSAKQILSMNAATRRTW